MTDLASAKANVAEVYGNAARLIRERLQPIYAGYDQATGQITGDASSRTASDAQQATAEQRGMEAGAASLGLTPPPPSSGLGSAASFRNVDRAQYQGDAEGWRHYLGDHLKHAEAGRNEAQAQAFGYLGSQAQDALTQLYAAMASRGGGGGGGYGRGGRGGRSSGPDTYPEWVDPAPDSAIRNAAATGVRLTRQADAFSNAGYSGPGSAARYGALLKQGMLKNGSSKPSSSSAKKPTSQSSLLFWRR